ncbi:MAG TPA: hypothetical protein VIH51_09445 [Myxococcales bacterium]
MTLTADLLSCRAEVHPKEAEGGPRHLIGPMVSAALFGQRMSAAAGPALALGAEQSHLLGRVALTYQF